MPGLRRHGELSRRGAGRRKQARARRFSVPALRCGTEQGQVGARAGNARRSGDGAIVAAGQVSAVHHQLRRWQGALRESARRRGPGHAGQDRRLAAARSRADHPFSHRSHVPRLANCAQGLHPCASLLSAARRTGNGLAVGKGASEPGRADSRLSGVHGGAGDLGFVGSQSLSTHSTRPPRRLTSESSADWRVLRRFATRRMQPLVQPWGQAGSVGQGLQPF